VWVKLLCCSVSLTRQHDGISDTVYNKCIGDDTKAAARQSLNCIKDKNKIKYGEKRFSIWRIEFLHPAMWHVAIESRQWIHQVAAPYNVIRGSGMTCHWIRRTSPILEFYIWFRFRPHHCSRHVILHQSPKFYSNRTTLGRKNDVMSIFKMADLSYLGFWGSNNGFFEKSNYKTSYRSSIDTITLNCLVFQKIAFLHFSVNIQNGGSPPS